MNSKDNTLKEHLDKLKRQNEVKKANKKYAQDLRAMGVALYFVEGEETQ